MNLLKFRCGFFSSKVARRIFILFLLCIILPFLTVAILTNYSVGSQLFDQVQKKLKRTAKNKGFEIYNNLLLLENELKIIIVRLKDLSPDNIIGQWPFESEMLREKYFNGIIILDRDNQTTNLFKTVKEVPTFSGDEIDYLRIGKTLLKILSSSDRYPSIFLCRRFYYKKSNPKTIIANINRIFLWGIGSNNALPPEIEFMVHYEKNLFLVSSLPDMKINKETLNKIQGSSSGNLVYHYHNMEYLASYWSLFIKPRFFIKNWTIITSQLKSSIYEPISNFRNNFFHFMLLAFLIVILLSLILIRRNLVPIELLKESTEKIANGEFDIKVNIKSGDEFEMLGESFNEMSKKLKEGQKLLIQAAKLSAFGKIAAGIVHEIGQPLSALSGLSYLLENEKTTKKQKERIKIIQNELERLTKIIHKFRTITRSEEVAMTLISIDQIIHEVYALFEHQIRIKKINFLVKKTDNLPLIFGDKDSLKQVFINLIINSMDALETKLDKKPFINIRTFTSNGFIHVKIEDNGIGIPTEIQSEIFDPFFTTKGSEKGSGLGLAIIESILHNHKAKIEMNSKMGSGTSFTLSFPIPDST